MGGDPVPGTVKACYCKGGKKPKKKAKKAMKAQGAHCAREGGTCKCNGAVTYGAKGKFRTKPAGGSIGCNNGVFGDPVPGTVKACYCKGGKKAKKKAKKATKAKGAHCAREGGTCKCNGAVTYGAKGKFRTKPAGGSIGCNNGVFGDPVPGTVKACYCKGGK